QAIIKLLAARNLRAVVDATAADDFAAAAVNRRRIGQTAGQDEERAAAGNRGAACGAAKFHDLRAAAVGNRTAGVAEDLLLAVAQRRADRKAARGNDLQPGLTRQI